MKQGFVDRIADVVREFHIPPELVINLDETGVKIVPVSTWTLEKKGVTQVPIVGIEDKQQITAVLATTLDGQLLPPQLLYEGRTNRCHPAVAFPKDWDIFHSKNHWSNGDTMLRYIEQVLLPWAEKWRSELGVRPNQRVLVIMDVFKSHSTPAVLEKMKDGHLKVVFVPGNCTGELQPLDISVNGTLKSLLKSKFSTWYADKVCQAMKLHPGDIKTSAAIVDPNLRLSVLKPLHAGWFMDAFVKLSSQSSTILQGWTKPGIADAVYGAFAVKAKKQPEETSSPGKIVNDAETSEGKKDRAQTSPSGKAAANGDANLSLLGNDRTIGGPLPSVLESERWKCWEGTDYYLPDIFCQSRIDNRNGSTACTVIATLVVKAVLEGTLELPDCGAEPSGAFLQDFMDVIRMGNRLYDTEAAKLGLLAVYHVLELWPELNLAPAKGLDLGFRDAVDATTKLTKWISTVFHSQSLQAGVFVQRPYSFAIVAGRGRLVVLDSHSHDKGARRRGSLVAVSGAKADIAGIVSYIVNFPVSVYRCPMHDSHLCVLELCVH